jgi:MFS family permease
MAKTLGGSAIEAFWSGTSFLLTSTVFQPVLGSFSHIFGRKPLIFVSLAFFLAGSIIAAVANNFTVILVGRSIQGIGGGGIIALTEIVVTDMVPLRERGKWFSIFSAMWSVGTVAGPLLGKCSFVYQGGNELIVSQVADFQRLSRGDGSSGSIFLLLESVV